MSRIVWPHALLLTAPEPGSITEHIEVDNEDRLALLHGVKPSNLMFCFFYTDSSQIYGCMDAGLIPEYIDHILSRYGLSNVSNNLKYLLLRDRNEILNKLVLSIYISILFTTYIHTWSDQILPPPVTDQEAYSFMFKMQLTKINLKIYFHCSKKTNYRKMGLAVLKVWYWRFVLFIWYWN